MGKGAWAKLFFANRRLIYSLAREGISRWQKHEATVGVSSAVPITEI
jgi:hypothetical protein